MAETRLPPDLVCEKFPSLCYYYQTEEPGMGIYATNDSEGEYFPDKFRTEVYTLENEYYSNTLPIGKPCSSDWKKSLGNP